MGVTITATNSSFSFDMGYGGFFNLRKNIALAVDEEFGQNYAKLNHCLTQEEYEENDRISEEIINRKHLDEKYKDVLDFLYMSDCEGSISYKACKEIYNLIKDVDFGNKGFRYIVYRHDDYEELKAFLKQCYSKRRKMRWH